MKTYLKVSFFAFLLNFLWENLHAPLYLHYRGGAISEWILLRAALVDAAIILALVFLLHSRSSFSRRPWFIFFFGLLVAVVLEKWALATGRWAYGPSMPIVPWLNVGLTPAIQLGLTGWLSHEIVFFKK